MTKPLIAAITGTLAFSGALAESYKTFTYFYVDKATLAVSLSSDFSSSFFINIVADEISNPAVKCFP